MTVKLSAFSLQYTYILLLLEDFPLVLEPPTESDIQGLLGFSWLHELDLQASDMKIQWEVLQSQ